MLEHLTRSLLLIGYWGYLVIFVVVVLECQPLLGLVMPGESAVVLGGFLAGRGILDLTLLVFVVSLAAVVGDNLGFRLGRLHGRGWLIRQAQRFGLRQQPLEKVERFFASHGGKAVFASHFTHLMRAMMSFVAGTSCMPYRRFLFYNAAGCITWATFFVLLGYVVGENWRAVERWLGHLGYAVLLLALVVGILLAWRNWERQRT